MIDLVAKRDDMDTRNGKGETFWIPPSPEISQYRLALEYLSGLSQKSDKADNDGCGSFCANISEWSGGSSREGDDRAGILC